MQLSRFVTPAFSALALALVTAVVASAPAHAQSLRGSRESVDLMYSTAQSEGLEFTRTTADIYEAARVGALKLIVMTDDLELDRATFPFVLPATKRFADSLAHEYHTACGERIGVTSGARPIDKQPRNASPKSVHPTGMAVDFRKPRNPVCLKWLRTSLVGLESAHIIEATEERHPVHFHVAVLHQDREPRFQLAALPDSGRVRTAAGDVALTHTTHTSHTSRRKTHRAARAHVNVDGSP
ncbi:MAG TPA: DUF5715 family protein [Gemmatimonadaceae bacterium]|nr:DUF5715 family protein [Gemmatimonadaceae bacterium]